MSAAGICYNIFFNISKVNHKWLNLSIIRPSKFGGYQIVFHDQNLSLTRGSFSSSTEIYVLQEEVFWHGNISCATQSWQRLQKKDLYFITKLEKWNTSRNKCCILKVCPPWFEFWFISILFQLQVRLIKEDWPQPTFMLGNMQSTSPSWSLLSSQSSLPPSSDDLEEVDWWFRE